MTLTRAGTPAVVVTTTAFEVLAHHEAYTLGMEALPLVTIDHPLGGEPRERVTAKATRAAIQLIARLGSTAEGHRPQESAAPAELLLDDALDVIEADFRARGWTDGLPIVPPTPERVAAMCAGIDAAPDHVLGKIPPLWGEATIEKVAVNAVMAGCRPVVMPVLVAALEAMLDPVFNLYGVQATTHPVAPLLIVNGPAIARLGMHAGAGVFGPGNAANATLGRAVRLCLWNLGSARPGAGDMATQGSPAKYGYAIAELEAANPWGPLHASLGFAPDAPVVTVFGGEAPHNVNDHVSERAVNLLGVVADTAATLGSNVGWYLDRSQLLVVLGPEHAATIAADGFSRGDVQRFLYEHARIPLARLRIGGMWGIQDWPRWMAAVDDATLLPIVPSPDDVFVMVAGGSGKHSSVVPNCAFSRAVSRAVTRWRT